MKKDKNKQLQKAGKKETSIVRSSAAEYLPMDAAAVAEVYMASFRAALPTVRLAHSDVACSTSPRSGPMGCWSCGPSRSMRRHGASTNATASWPWS